MQLNQSCQTALISKIAAAAKKSRLMSIAAHADELFADCGELATFGFVRWPHKSVFAPAARHDGMVVDMACFDSLTERSVVIFWLLGGFRHPSEVMSMRTSQDRWSACGE